MLFHLQTSYLVPRYNSIRHIQWPKCPWPWSNMVTGQGYFFLKLIKKNLNNWPYPGCYFTHIPHHIYYHNFFLLIWVLPNDLLSYLLFETNYILSWFILSGWLSSIHYNVMTLCLSGHSPTHYPFSFQRSPPAFYWFHFYQRLVSAFGNFHSHVVRFLCYLQYFFFFIIFFKAFFFFNF